MAMPRAAADMLQSALGGRVSPPWQRCCAIQRLAFQRRAQERRVVEIRRAQDLSGIEQEARIELRLEILEKLKPLWAKYALQRLASGEAEAVAGSERALMLAQKLGHGVRQCAHRSAVLRLLQVQDGPDLKAAASGLPVDRGAHAILRQKLGKLLAIGG